MPLAQGRSAAFPLLTVGERYPSALVPLISVHLSSPSINRRAIMRPTLVARMYTAQLTLFTRANCGLCDTAKTRLEEVRKKRTVEYDEVDIIAEGNQKWRNMYGKVPDQLSHLRETTAARPEQFPKGQRSYRLRKASRSMISTLTSSNLEFDVPVLHVERVFHTYSKPNIVTEAQKLMHRFTVEEVEKLIDEAEQGAP